MSWWILALVACRPSLAPDPGLGDSGELFDDPGETDGWVGDTAATSCPLDFDGCDVDCDGLPDWDVVLLRQPEGAELWFTDLAAAASVARDGSEIQLCPGSYDASVLLTADLDLHAWDSGFPYRPDVWAVDDAVGALTVGEGHVVRIGGLRIAADCSAETAGGSAGGFGSPGGSWGGTQQGACVDSIGVEVLPGANVHIVNSGIRDHSGGGVIARDPVRLELTRVEVVDNAGVDGAGLFVQGGTTVLTDSRFVRNVAFGAGGGVHADLCDQPLTVTDVQLFDNAAVEGGGLYARDCEVLGTQNGLEVTFNSAQIGGGAVLRNAPLTGPFHCFANNVAEDGGGLLVHGSGAVAGGRIEGNVASNRGGGLYVDGSGTVQIDAEIEGNTADEGGGVYVQDGAVVVRSPHVWDNASLLGRGGAAAIAGGSLSAVEGDWGTALAGTDNDPADVLPLQASDHAVFDTGVCFDCTATACDACP